MGCIARLGCLFVLVVLAAVAWFERDLWLPRVLHHRSGPVAVAPAEHWAPLSNAAADSASDALKRLSEPRGQVFERVSPAALASYIFRDVAKRPATPDDSVEAVVVGDKLSLRAVVPLKDLGGALGSAVGIVHDRERVELTGTLNVVKPGLAEFAVSEARIRGVPIPKGMIATLIGRFEPVPAPAGSDPNALPLPIPRYIGDIRVGGANGKVTLYKTVR